MSTDYTLVCSPDSNPAFSAELTIIDSLNILPGSDTWETPDIEAWGLEGGAVANWGTDEIMLYGIGAGTVVTLQSLTKDTKPGDSGQGHKSLIDGSFPAGAFDWTCKLVD